MKHVFNACKRDMKTKRRFFRKVCLFRSKFNAKTVYVREGKVILIAMMKDKKEMKVPSFQFYDSQKMQIYERFFQND